MKTNRTKKTRLPRVTVYAMSSKELTRFATAAEQVVGLAHLMVGLMTRLDAAVTRLEARTAAAAKAAATRRAKADSPDGDTIEQVPPATSAE